MSVSTYLVDLVGGAAHMWNGECHSRPFECQHRIRQHYLHSRRTMHTCRYTMLGVAMHTGVHPGGWAFEFRHTVLTIVTLLIECPQSPAARPGTASAHET